MNRELEILSLADYYERISYKNASAYLIINNKMEEHKCLFGFVELPQDFETVDKLFALVEKRAKELGHKEIVGPLNYCTWMSYRWALNMFDTRYYPDCENPSYYPEYIKKLGYKPLYTYRSATVKMKNMLFDMGEEILGQKQAEGFEFKLFENEQVYDKAKEVYDISANSFRGGPLYSEIPFEYFTEVYLAWTKNIKPALFIAYKDGEAVGYVYGYENIYNNSYISKTSAVKKKYQKHRLYLALIYLGYSYILNKGYDEAVYHFECEQRATFKRFDSNTESNEKRYAVYIKEL